MKKGSEVLLQNISVFKSFTIINYWLFQLDSDLYDKVSYLDLMSQYEERERQRRMKEAKDFRYLREQ